MWSCTLKLSGWTGKKTHVTCSCTMALQLELQPGSELISLYGADWFTQFKLKHGTYCSSRK